MARIPAAAVTGSGPQYTPIMGAPAAVSLARPQLSASLAAAEGVGSSQRAFCAAIELADGKAPEWIRLFPAGPELRAVDGRRWQLSDPQAVAALTEQRRGGIELCLDWEHAQDRKAPEGERAEAAGWIKQVAVRDGALMARVEWTEAGRASVESKGYRYFSASFTHERKIRLPAQPDGGEVAAVIGGSLVNRPAFDMPALAGQQQEDPMLKKLLEALGLAADAAEEKALAAIAALKAERDEAVSQAAAAPPLDKFVPRADYEAAQARAATAEGKLATEAKARLDEEIKAALDAAQQAGKITPATREYHEAQCAAEGGLERFKKLYLPNASELGGPSGAPSGSPPQAGASALERSVAKAMGHSVEFAREHGGTEEAD